MSTKSWTVDADGMEHLVSLESDPATGRTSIRVDGRMVGRPLGADEAERIFPVGSVAYVVRRTGDEFALDFAPREAVPTTTRPGTKVLSKTSGTSKHTASSKQASSLPLIPIIIGIVALFGIVGLFSRGRASKPASARKSVQWVPYTARDGSFTVRFPGEPKLEAEAEYYDNYRYTYYSLESASDDAHAYKVEYCDLPVEIGDSNATDVLLDWLRWWMKENNGTLVSQKPARIDGFRGVHFTTTYSASASENRRSGMTKGQAIIANRRVFFIYADVPMNDVDIPEVATFLASMDIR